MQCVLEFWTLHLVFRIATAVIGGTPQELFDPRLRIGMSCGFVLSIGFCMLLRLSTRRGLAFRLNAASLTCVMCQIWKA